MGLFNKRTDPIKDRERDLTSEIRQLERQISALKGVLQASRDDAPDPETPVPAETNTPRSRPQESPKKAESGEMVFETVSARRLQGSNVNPFKDSHDPQALQREGSSTIIEKLLRYFRGPTSSNPKLVSYLAAGNIHGLQPLRYERRVARNRLLLWIVIIMVLIVGMLKMLLP